VFADANCGFSLTDARRFVRTRRQRHRCATRAAVRHLGQCAQLPARGTDRWCSTSRSSRWQR
jgi:hypothetical protein